MATNNPSRGRSFRVVFQQASSSVSSYPESGEGAWQLDCRNTMRGDCGTRRMKESANRYWRGDRMIGDGTTGLVTGWSIYSVCVRLDHLHARRYPMILLSISNPP